jgi:hypothetical protein
VSDLADPTGFDLPADLSAVRIEREDELLIVESQTLAVVDLDKIEDIIERAYPYTSGAQVLPNWICTPEGTLCHTGQDGQFDATAYTRNDHVHAIDIYFDDVEPDHASWVLAGFTTIATSAVAVLGDPAFLTHYVHDPFPGPLTATGPWTLLALPGPGVLAIHLLKHHAKIDHPNIALRATWQATPS